MGPDSGELNQFGSMRIRIRKERTIMMNWTQCDMTNVSLDGDESLSQQPLSPGENMGDLVLPQLEERIETLKESDPCPL
jgi:hypothetical protein